MENGKSEAVMGEKASRTQKLTNVERLIKTIQECAEFPNITNNRLKVILKTSLERALYAGLIERSRNFENSVGVTGRFKLVKQPKMTTTATGKSKGTSKNRLKRRMSMHKPPTPKKIISSPIKKMAKKRAPKATKSSEELSKSTEEFVKSAGKRTPKKTVAETSKCKPRPPKKPQAIPKIKSRTKVLAK